MNAIKKLKPFQVILIVLAFTLCNCVSDDYNLKDGVNTDVTLGGDSLFFPLGKTKPKLLSTIINSDSLKSIVMAADSTYSMQLKDTSRQFVKKFNLVTFSSVPYSIAPVNSIFLTTDTPPQGVKSFPLNNYSTQFISLKDHPLLTRMSLKNKNSVAKSATENHTYYYNIPEQTFHVIVNKFISEDVKRVNRFTFKSASQLEFRIQLNNINPGVDSLHFYNYKIKFPPFLKFNDPAVNSSNELILNDSFSVSDGFTKILTFTVIDFGTEGIALTNGTLNLDEITSMQGKAYIRNTNLTTDEIGTFEIQPSINIADMVVSLIDGEIKPVIAPVTKNIAFKLPGIFKQSGNLLDIQNPVITLTVGNSMGFTIDAGIQMIPTNNGTAIPNGSVSTQFTVPAADKLGQTSWNQYWMSKSAVGVSQNYQSIIVPDLPNLLRIAPDDIDIQVTPVVNGNRQLVDLYQQKNQLDFMYSVNVPLDFGNDFNIQYLDTIKDMKDKLSNIIDLVNQVVIVAVVDNKIPLNLNLEVFPLDSAKILIPGISITSPDSIKSCNINGSSQRSLINIGFKENEVGSLKLLDALKIKISARKNSTIAGLPLKGNQSITVQMGVKIPKGVNTNLKKTSK